MVALTGRSEAYYTDYLGSPQEFVAAAKHGFLYQGQYYAWQQQPRGSAALDLSPTKFVTFLQNHVRRPDLHVHRVYLTGHKSGVVG